MLRHAIAVVAALWAHAALAAPEIGKPAPDFTGTDYLGRAAKLSDYKGKVVVLEWNNPECPFVRKHYGSGNMQKLQKYAHDKGVIWLTVNSSARGKQGFLSREKAQEVFAQNRPLGDRYILDHDGKIGRLYQAKVTPHMFVVDTLGNLAYMGAIDDKPTPKPEDIATANNYVQAALDGLLESKPIATHTTQAYGCNVKYD